MTLGEFRRQTADLGDDFELELDTDHGCCGELPVQEISVSKSTLKTSPDGVTYREGVDCVTVRR